MLAFPVCTAEEVTKKINRKSMNQPICDKKTPKYKFQQVL
jgi:hypothetical protein